MTAFLVIGILLLLLVGVRVGVILRFGERTTLKLRIGPVRLTILPKKKKEKQTKTAPTEETNKSSASPKKKNKLTPSERYELVSAVFSGLRAMAHRAGKHLRVDPLELSAVIGGSDPAEVAQRFGTANAVVWSFLPQAEEVLHIPDPHIRLDMDFNAPKTVVSGTVGLSFRVGNLIEFIVAAALPLLRWYKTYRKAHANGKNPGKAALTATEQTEEKLSA